MPLMHHANPQQAIFAYMNWKTLMTQWVWQAAACRMGVYLVFGMTAGFYLNSPGLSGQLAFM